MKSLLRYFPRWSSSLATWQVAQGVQQQEAQTSPATLPSIWLSSRTAPRWIRVGMQGMINPSRQWRHWLFSNRPAFSTCKQQWQKYPHRPRNRQKLVRYNRIYDIYLFYKTLTLLNNNLIQLHRFIIQEFVEKVEK